MSRKSGYDLIIPWRGGCPWRERALAYVTKRYREDYPQFNLIRVDNEVGAWCKAVPIYEGLKLATSEFVAVLDADVWTDGLPNAFSLAEQGAPWVVPHDLVFRLDEQGTADFMDSVAPVRELDRAERVMHGRTGGGALVARRTTLLRIPPDPRFIGWGNEDEAWAIALRFLMGRPERGSADMVHLWHPPQERMNRRWGSKKNWQLRQKYQRAQRDRTEMEALVEEAHDALSAS